MISVEEAERIILSQKKDFGNETLELEKALGYILAEDLKTDRDLPAYNKVTMDGIAINYKAIENGINKFKIIATQAAGEPPLEINNEDECIEIMTGAILPNNTNTIIRYEDLEITDKQAILGSKVIKNGQNVHLKGTDKKENEIVVNAGRVVDAAVIGIAATVGATKLLVKKQPKIIIISTGNELVEIAETPAPYQIRSSNNYTIKALLKLQNINATCLHIDDDLDTTIKTIKDCLEKYDIILLTGGISMGKFDFVPQALEACGVHKFFHKVQQRPGKPFWFGKHENNAIVFALPGNPVSVFLCMIRYVLPWLFKNTGRHALPILHALLGVDVHFKPSLQYFVQVKVNVNNKGQLVATPLEGNGSGDFSNILDTNAFMELPVGKETYTRGDVYRIWQFKPLFV